MNAENRVGNKFICDRFNFTHWLNCTAQTQLSAFISSWHILICVEFCSECEWVICLNWQVCLVWMEKSIMKCDKIKRNVLFLFRWFMFANGLCALKHTRISMSKRNVAFRQEVISSGSSVDWVWIVWFGLVGCMRCLRVCLSEYRSHSMDSLKAVWLLGLLFFSFSHYELLKAGRIIFNVHNFVVLPFCVSLFRRESFFIHFDTFSVATTTTATDEEDDVEKKEKHMKSLQYTN